MSPRRRRGPEHVSWWWALQVLGFITIIAAICLGTAFLFGWV